MPRPRKEIKAVQVSCRVSLEMETLIEDLAENLGLPKAAIGGEFLKIGIAAWREGKAVLFNAYDNKNDGLLKTA